MNSVHNKTFFCHGYGPNRLRTSMKADLCLNINIVFAFGICHSQENSWNELNQLQGIFLKFREIIFLILTIFFYYFSLTFMSLGYSNLDELDSMLVHEF